MLIKMLTVGILQTNCFIVIDTKTRAAIIIDPGSYDSSEVKSILNEIQRGRCKIEFIVNTHGHPDHIWGNKRMKEATGAPILVHESDTPLLRNPSADKTLHEGDIIEVGDVKLRVLHTPGHTKGSIALLGEEDVFVGDTLFAGSIGRYDLPGGSLKDLMD